MALPLRIEPIEHHRTWEQQRSPVRLQLIVGGRTDHQLRLDSSVYRRRRLAAALLLVVVVAVGSFLVREINRTGALVLPTMASSSQQIPTGINDDAPGTLRGQVIVRGGVYIAQHGDTLWLIARALKPSGELSSVLHKLIRLNGGPSLEIGQRVVLPK